MNLDIFVGVFVVIAIGAFLACWRMEHVSDKDDDHNNIKSNKDKEGDL